MKQWAHNLIDLIGRTPVKVFSDQGSVVLAKLEGNNPGGSVKDRAYQMITDAENSKIIKPGDTIIEAAEIRIALAMVAAMKNYKIKLIMPETASEESKNYEGPMELMNFGNKRRGYGRSTRCYEAKILVRELY